MTGYYLWLPKLSLYFPQLNLTPGIPWGRVAVLLLGNNLQICDIFLPSSAYLKGWGCLIFIWSSHGSIFPSIFQWCWSSCASFNYFQVLFKFRYTLNSFKIFLLDWFRLSSTWTFNIMPNSNDWKTSKIN